MTISTGWSTALTNRMRKIFWTPLSSLVMLEFDIRIVSPCRSFEIKNLNSIRVDRHQRFSRTEPTALFSTMKNIIWRARFLLLFQSSTEESVSLLDKSNFNEIWSSSTISPSRWNALRRTMKKIIWTQRFSLVILESSMQESLSLVGNSKSNISIEYLSIIIDNFAKAIDSCSYCNKKRSFDSTLLSCYSRVRLKSRFLLPTIGNRTSRFNACCLLSTISIHRSTSLTVMVQSRTPITPQVPRLLSSSRNNKQTQTVTLRTDSLTALIGTPEHWSIIENVSLGLVFSRRFAGCSNG